MISPASTDSRDHDLAAELAEALREMVEAAESPYRVVLEKAIQRARTVLETFQRSRS